MLKTCLACPNEVPKKTYESKARYERKKFCSTTCAKKYMRENKLGWFSPIKKSDDYLDFADL